MVREGNAKEQERGQRGVKEGQDNKSRERTRDKNKKEGKEEQRRCCEDCRTSPQVIQRKESMESHFSLFKTGVNTIQLG